jgi:hypothetical protein
MRLDGRNHIYELRENTVEICGNILVDPENASAQQGDFIRSCGNDRYNMLDQVEACEMVG